MLLKVEHDSTLTSRPELPFDDPKSRISFGFDYLYNDNINIGLSAERGNTISLKFSVKQGLEAKQFKYVTPTKIDNESKETSFIRNIQANGLGINEIFEDEDTIGIEVMQFSHPSLDIIEEIIMTAKGESGINKDIKVNYKIHGLNADDEFDQAFKNRAKQIYQRQGKASFYQDTRVTVRPFLAAREDFLKLSVMLNNDGEYIFQRTFSLHIILNIPYGIILKI